MKKVTRKGYPIRLCTVLWLSLHRNSTIEPSRCIWCNKITEKVTFNPCAKRFDSFNPLGVDEKDRVMLLSESVTRCVKEKLDR